MTTATAPSSGTTQVSGQGNAEQARRTELRHLQSMELGLAELPAAQAYLDRLMERIRAAGPQPAPYARVLVRPRLSYNAATTPKGHILIDLGWLKPIPSEAELVALLSHEYGHIVLDHLGGKNQVGTATHYMSLAATVAVVKSGTGNFLPSAAMNGAWSNLLMPAWSRKQELDADTYAVNITQSIGYAHVPSVRAFLERIQSVERSATAMPVPTTTPGKTAPGVATTAAARSEPAASTTGQTSTSLADDHPSIEERLAHVQQLVEGRPRTRPVARATDEWREIRGSGEFKAAEEEYILAARYWDALKERRIAELDTLAGAIGRRPGPLRTAACKTILALSLPRPSLERGIALLKEATVAPDASFFPYAMLAGVQRDVLLQFDVAVDTLQAGLDRFDSPPQHYADAIEFLFGIQQRLEAIPSNQRTLGQSIFMLSMSAKMIGLRSKCLAHPAYSDACGWAGLTDAQRQARLQAQRNQEAGIANKVEQRLQKVFK